MPAVSVKQRRLIGLAEHNPGKVWAKNRSILDMSHQQMHDFAATKEKDLPLKALSNARKKRRKF